jgi:hypothetical protein
MEGTEATPVSLEALWDPLRYDTMDDSRNHQGAIERFSVCDLALTLCIQAKVAFEEDSANEASNERSFLVREVDAS